MKSIKLTLTFVLESNGKFIRDPGIEYDSTFLVNKELYIRLKEHKDNETMIFYDRYSNTEIIYYYISEISVFEFFDKSDETIVVNCSWCNELRRKKCKCTDGEWCYCVKNELTLYKIFRKLNELYLF